jgi:hypothetical protein
MFLNCSVGCAIQYSHLLAQSVFYTYILFSPTSHADCCVLIHLFCITCFIILILGTATCFSTYFNPHQGQWLPCSNIRAHSDNHSLINPLFSYLSMTFTLGSFLECHYFYYFFFLINLGHSHMLREGSDLLDSPFFFLFPWRGPGFDTSRTTKGLNKLNIGRNILCVNCSKIS